jgi:hypothetical protein
LDQYPTHGERVSSLGPSGEVGIVIGRPVSSDVVRRGSVRRVTSHLSNIGSLVDSHVVDEEVSGIGQLIQVDSLEIVRGSKVDDLLCVNSLL